LKYLIYLHGFNSSPQSEKAQLTTDYFQLQSKKTAQVINIFVPALPPAPLDAISLVHDLIKLHGRENLLGFIGSSLGGFYSIYLQQYYSHQENILKAILINPAVHPYDLLTNYLGENQNLYTGESYIIDSSHMEDLKSLVVKPIVQADFTMILTQTEDEVLNYQEAVSYFEGASMWIQYGGSHAFENFASALPCIYSFCFKR
jgi:predicted esterase YcpF (UPF0227 family)